MEDSKDKSIRNKKLKFARNVVVVSIAIIAIFAVARLYIQKGSTGISSDNARTLSVEDYEEFNLTQEEVDDLIESDLGRISLAEAEELIIKYSESLTNSQLVNDFFNQVVKISCENDDEFSEGSGFLTQNELSEWVVYTNAHITNATEKCMVSMMLDSADTYDAVVVYVADNYPYVDFSQLKIVNPNNLPNTKVRKCESGDNYFLDRVIVLGYPSGYIVTTGYINEFPEEREVIKTSAKAYPGSSGGLGFNLSKDCAIGIVSWSEEVTFSALIQPWDMLKI